MKIFGASPKKSTKKKKVHAVDTPEGAIRLRKREAKQRQDIKKFIFTALLTAVFIWILFGVVFGIRSMKNDDMMPRISAGDLMLFYRLESNYRQDDVVTFKRNGTAHTGRIVAQGGDTVEVTDDALLVINGNRVVEPDIYFETPAFDSDVTYPVVLAEDEFFILGDYRNGAHDSRYYGPVRRSEIDGAVILVFRRSNI